MVFSRKEFKFFGAGFTCAKKASIAVPAMPHSRANMNFVGTFYDAVCEGITTPAVAGITTAKLSKANIVDNLDGLMQICLTFIEFLSISVEDDDRAKFTVEFCLALRMFMEGHAKTPAKERCLKVKDSYWPAKPVLPDGTDELCKYSRVCRLRFFFSTSQFPVIAFKLDMSCSTLRWLRMQGPEVDPAYAELRQVFAVLEGALHDCHFLLQGLPLLKRVNCDLMRQLPPSPEQSPSAASDAAMASDDNDDDAVTLILGQSEELGAMIAQARKDFDN